MNSCDKIFSSIEKAARYTGGEFNSPEIKYGKNTVSFCFCFPDMYEVAMSNLGLKILYSVINNNPDTVCERCFTPSDEFAAALKNAGERLFSIETKRRLTDFDMLGFSFQYELSYSNFLYMLDLAGIPFYARERGEDYPLVIGGGPCMINPEPISDFLDLCVIGDGEYTAPALIELYKKHKKNGGKKAVFLAEAAKIEGVYVPSLPARKVKKAMVKNLDEAPFPEKFLIPNIEIVHDRAVLELFRGCTRGCRFCQAGFIYRPLRARSVDTLEKQALKIIETSGYEEMSLSSLSTGDFEGLRELASRLRPHAEKLNFTVSLPSLRMDSFDPEMTENSRKNSLTFAPEAGTQRLRNVINKNIIEENITATLTDAFGRGYDNVKLYFMLGLPTETMDDVSGIVALADKIKSLYRQITAGKGRPLRLGVSASVFIPKPHTPFQWAAQIDMEEARKRQNYLREELRRRKVNFSYHDADSSEIEAILARGDRRLSAALVKAYEKGAKMDGWTERFRYGAYIDALNECGIDKTDYLREYEPTEKLAWDFVDIGVSKEYLKNEYKKALAAETTADCRQSCNGCGIEDCNQKL